MKIKSGMTGRLQDGLVSIDSSLWRTAGQELSTCNWVENLQVSVFCVG